MAMSQNRKQLATLGGALVIAAGLGAWAWLGVFEKEKADDARKEEEARLFTLDVNSVTSLTVAAKGEVTELARTGDDWRIVKPLEAPADHAAIESLLDRLSTAKRKKLLVESDGKPEMFGLDAPGVRVSATTTAGEKAELAFGTQNTFDRTWFVSARPGEIASADAGLKSAFEKGTFELRDKRVVVFGDDGLEGLTSSGATSWSLVRSGEGWQIAGPAPEAAGEEMVGKILRTLHDLRAMAFPTGDAEAYGLASPGLTLELRRKDQPPLTLRFGTVGDKRYVRQGDGPVAEITAAAVESLTRRSEELRAPPPPAESAAAEAAGAAPAEPAD
ncbi:DUF4340 domain-containing protein [Vulgatibacter incomptus]|uniref:DUF4340 domain-containing protein n=1 Tax=Vulgatibacter incomptus TaxID=1391653 RepID=A0A0K1PE22_9BACT|nr:DUF4340 domain-containing protein [Vulgatibacter incomptus]AKU91374.1 hypothetical protein AKJ08_1761 [Vulgatibacter incomptus]